MRKIIQGWFMPEGKEDRRVDVTHVNKRLSEIVLDQVNEPRSEFDGLSSEEMSVLLFRPFSRDCVVQLNRLDATQYSEIPLVRQAIFLMKKLNKKELKMTKNGWLPLKVVDECYHLGRPIDFIESFGQKRINEYDSTSTWMSRELLQYLGWIKIRKGMMSLTAKGTKAFSNIDKAANEILKSSLTSGILHYVDFIEDTQVGNLGIAYSVWILNKYGDEWRFGDFYKEKYEIALPFTNSRHIYEARVFERLFYWLGILDKRRNREVGPPFELEYKKTDLLPMIFSFKV